MIVLGVVLALYFFAQTVLLASGNLVLPTSQVTVLSLWLFIMTVAILLNLIENKKK